MRVGRAGAASAVLLMFGACDEPTTGIEPRVTTCGESAGTRAVSAQSTTWLRANSPYVIENSVTIGILGIEPGVRVCALADAELVVSESLSAIGTRADSVLFLPAEPDGSWGGLRIGVGFDDYEGPLSRLRHVRIEGGGIDANNPLQIDSSVVRGGHVTFAGTLRHVLVDGGGVHVPGYGRGTVEDLTVRNSPTAGVSVSRRASIRLNGVRIEGSQGIGFSAHAYIGGAANVMIDGPLRITGGASYPAYGPVDMVDQLFREPGSVDSFTGNARDTLLLGSNGRSTQPMTITAALPWRIGDGGGCMCGSLDQVHMEAGASLVVEGDPLSGVYIDALSVAGSAGRNATIKGVSEEFPDLPVLVSLGGATADAIHLSGLQLDNVRLVLSDSQAAVIQDVSGTRSSIVAMGTGSTLSGVRLRDTWGAAIVLGPAAVLEQSSVIGSAREGIVVRGADVRVSDCTVGGNDDYGIHIESGSAVISQCSLLANRRETVFNSTATPVDARNNWWGSPDGPGSPGAGTTGGPVDYLPFLDQPPGNAGSAAAHVEIVRILPVATSDTMTVVAEVRDAAGDVLPFENVLWSIGDTAIATIFADGLVHGLVAGVTTVTARISGDTTLRATEALEVLPGAPVYDWIRHELNELISTVAAADGVMFVAAGAGTVRRYDGSAWTSYAFDDAGDARLIWARRASDAYVIMQKVDPDLSRAVSQLYHFDGTAWTHVREFEGFTNAVSGAGASDLFVGGSFGLWHYDAEEWHHRITTPLSSMAARSPTDVFFSGGIDSGYGVRHFDGAIVRDVGGPPGLHLWGSDGALFGAGSAAFDLFEYHGPFDWRAVMSNTPLRVRWVDGNTATDVFALSLSGSLWYYDGSRTHAVWLGGLSALSPMWIDVDGDHVYIADYAGSIYVGVRRN